MLSSRHELQTMLLHLQNVDLPLSYLAPILQLKELDEMQIHWSHQYHMEVSRCIRAQEGMPDRMPHHRRQPLPYRQWAEPRWKMMIRKWPNPALDATNCEHARPSLLFSGFANLQFPVHQPAQGRRVLDSKLPKRVSVQLPVEARHACGQTLQGSVHLASLQVGHHFRLIVLNIDFQHIQDVAWVHGYAQNVWGKQNTAFQRI